MLAMQRVSDAQLSPDGKWVLHGLRTTDLAANRGRSDLWLTAVDGIPIPETAKMLGRTVGSVYTARSRVIRRLQDLARDFAEEDSTATADDGEDLGS